MAIEPPELEMRVAILLKKAEEKIDAVEDHKDRIPMRDGYKDMLAGLQVKLNKLTTPDKQAQLNVDGQQTWVREGTRFLNGLFLCKYNVFAHLKFFLFKNAMPIWKHNLNSLLNVRNHWLFI